MQILLFYSSSSTKSREITHRSGSNLDVEHILFVAHFCYFWPRKSIYVQCVVVNVNSIGRNSDTDIN